MSEQEVEVNNNTNPPIKGRMNASKYCTEHPKEFNRMYCTDCNSLVCGDCIVGPHQQHSFDKISLATETKLQELQDFLEKLKSQIQPELLQHVEKIETAHQEYSKCDELIREEINNRIENLKNELDNIRDSLNAEVQQKLQNDLQKLESSKVTVKQNLTEVENTIKEYEDIVSQLDSKPDREALLLIMEAKQDLEKFESQTDVESVPLPTFLSLGLDESMKTKINNYIDSEAVKEHFNETPRPAVNGDGDDDNDETNNNNDENGDDAEDEENMDPSSNQKSFEDLNPDDLENEETDNFVSNLTQDKTFKPIQRLMEYDDEQDDDNQINELEPCKQPTVRNVPVRSKRNHFNNRTEEVDRITEEKMDSGEENPDPTDNNHQYSSQYRRLGKSGYDSDQSRDINIDVDDINPKTLQPQNMDENNIYKGIRDSNYSRNIETNPNNNNDDILQQALDILNEDVEDSNIQYGVEEVQEDEEDEDDEYDFKIKKKKGKDHKVKNKHMKEQHNEEHKTEDGDNKGDNPRMDERIDRRHMKEQHNEKQKTKDDENKGDNPRSDKRIDKRNDDKIDKRHAEHLKQHNARNGEKVEVHQQRKPMQEYKADNTEQTEPEIPRDKVHQTRVQPDMSRDMAHRTHIQPEMSKDRVHRTQIQPDISRDTVHQTHVQPEMSRAPGTSLPEVKQTVKKRLSNKSETVINISKTKTSFIGKVDTTKAFGHFDSKCMSVLSNNEVWIGNNSKNELVLIGYNSEILQRVKTDFSFEAIATTQTGELLVAETNNGLIMKITTQNEVETFADISPFRVSCIYVTESNNLLCGLMKQDGEAKVIKMSAKGRIALTFQYDERSKKQLFKKPFSITQNKNRDIWVVEDSLCSPVKVIDKNGKFKFTYTGLKDTSTFGKFSPSYVLGVNTNVLISDDNNHSVHLVDQDGQFLCFVIFKDEHICNPTSLDKDTDGNIWIKCADNKINVVSLY